MHQWPLGVLLVLAGGSPGLAQSFDELREELRRAAASEHVGDLVQGLTGFAALPGVSAANFRIDAEDPDDPVIDAAKFVLPLAHDFDRLGLFGQPLHGELTLGYFRAEQNSTESFRRAGFAAAADNDYSAISAVAGLGISFALTERLTLRPLLLAGYTYVEDDSDFSGPDGPVLDELTRGYLFNFQADVALLGAALQAEYRREFAGDLRFTGNVRYNQLHADTFAASDPVLETDSNYGVLTGFAQLDGPLGLRLLGHDLRWIGFLANSSFPGNQSAALGFDYFFELGGGIELVDREVVSGIEGVSLRGSALFGDAISGWSVGLQLEF
jgi:hypothetical protein